MAKLNVEDDLLDSNSLISRFMEQRINRTLDDALDFSSSFQERGIKARVNLPNGNIKVTWFILTLKELMMW